MNHWRNVGKDLYGSAKFWPQLEDLARRKTAQMFNQPKPALPFTAAMESLPKVAPSWLDLNRDRVIIGKKEDLEALQAERIQVILRQLMPWRKGPFELFGTFIDGEWVSSLKWNRLKNHIASLEGRRILDIGCSNGYYMFRMAAQQPESILGIEPYRLFFTQFLLLQHYARVPQIYCLPAKLEELTSCNFFFDTVFCMGILYHQRSPLDTLTQIHSKMVSGGQLVLETLIITDDADLCLFPAKRYGKMNNVYFIPTVACLTHWLRRTGFEDIRCVDITQTTSAEQRKTTWIKSQSLADFLAPHDPSLTIEGYPAPTRAVLLARAR